VSRRQPALVSTSEPDVDSTQGPAEQRYEKLRSDRDRWLARARRACRLTLPWLVPAANDPDQGQPDTYPLPWNDIGAEGHQHLASRWLLAVMPASETFFKYTIDEKQRATLISDARQGGTAEADIAKSMVEFDRSLLALEQSVLREINSTADRAVVLEAMVHLIGPGNIVLYDDEKDGLTCYHLNRYCIKRDPMGRPLELVICESFTEDSLPNVVAEHLGLLKDEESEDYSPDPLAPNKVMDEEEVIKVYTHVEWNYTDGKVKWCQECKGEEIEGQDKEVNIEISPWMPLRATRIDSCDYGPGYIEARCLAALQTAESLSQALTEGAMIAAESKNVVRPGGVTSIKDLVACRNGGYVTGHPDDVKELGSDGRRGQGLVVAEARLQRVEAALKRAFMMSNVRDSERTTAEEIRMVAQQMDEGQVGIYSVLTTEFQNPYITRKLHVLTSQGKIKLPDDLVKPVVSVGLAAVGRGNDLEKMMRFIQGLDALSKIVGPQEVAARVDVSDAITRLSNGLGLESIDLVLSEEKVNEIKAQQMQAAQQEQLMRSPMADPAKLATAAATAQQMQGEPPPPE
jgi:Bacteriophage head to tail connecting protein